MGVFLTILLGVIALLLIGVVVTIIYIRWNRGKLEKLNIPIVKPHWIFGSNYNGHNELQHETDLERFKRYGHVYGVYDGREPAIFISDVNLLRKILSKDFEHFQNHRKFLVEHNIMNELLDFLVGEKWREVRAQLTPQFTTGKIKSRCDVISELSQDYTNSLSKTVDENGRVKVEFRRHVEPLIFEIIGKIFCGINIENARDPENIFIKNMKLAMGGDSLDFDWTVTYLNCVPILLHLVPVFSQGALDHFCNTMFGIFKEREKLTSQPSDMVNTLLELIKRGNVDEYYKKLKITKNTALAQAFEFFVASFEGTRSTVFFLVYELAQNEKIQEKLLAEVDKALLKSGGKVNWDTLGELPYLTACITETLRKYPSFYRPDRVCTKKWLDSESGLVIEKGMTVIIPLFALHRNTEYYENPNEFYPDRFLEGNKDKLDPYAFGTFGHGPRACIGQRFAYEMLKVIMIHYLKEFRIEKREDTVLEFKVGNPIFMQCQPVYVDFIKRTNK